jgi:hypothetical protein
MQAHKVAWTYKHEKEDNLLEFFRVLTMGGIIQKHWINLKQLGEKNIPWLFALGGKTGRK